MNLSEEGIRKMVSSALVSYMVVVAVYLWFIDLLARQGEFGIFLATELMAFSMLLYMFTKPSLQAMNKSWFIAGCVSIALFLTVALLK